MSEKNKRIDLLDSFRGIAILAMVFYHALYDLDDIFGVKINIIHTFLFEIVRQPFTWAFILLAGISCRFSHSNLIRGARILGFGLIITAFTLIFAPGESIYFGILHFIGTAVLLYILVRPLLDRIPRWISITVLTLLFAFTFTMPETHILGLPGLFGVTLPMSFFSTSFLFPLGFPNLDFFSADYFPLIPWIFLFLLGAVIGTPIKERRFPGWFYSVKMPPLSFCGRHTLMIYIIHQPIVYGLFYFLFNIGPILFQYINAFLKSIFNF